MRIRGGDKMKEGSLFFGTSSRFVAGVFFLFGLIACDGGTIAKTKTQDFNNRYPQGLIEANLNDATVVLHIVVKDVRLDKAKSLRSDSGKIGYAALMFDCEVVDAYKGDLTAGADIAFISFWEYYNTLLEDQRSADRHRIVFLNKGQEGSYHALSFGIFDFSGELDASIKKHVRAGGKA